jgi:hypothetical protein
MCNQLWQSKLYLSVLALYYYDLFHILLSGWLTFGSVIWCLCCVTYYMFYVMLHAVNCYFTRYILYITLCVICYVTLHVTLSYVIRYIVCYVTCHNVMSCHVTLYYAMFAILHYVMFHYVTLHLVMLCYKLQDSLTAFITLC